MISSNETDPLCDGPPFRGPFALPARFQYETIFDNPLYTIFPFILSFGGAIFYLYGAEGYYESGALFFAFGVLLILLAIVTSIGQSDIVILECGIARATRWRKWRLVRWPAIIKVTVIPMQDFDENDVPYARQSINPLKRMAVEATGVPMNLYVFQYSKGNRLAKFRLDDRVAGADNMKILLNYFLERNSIPIEKKSW
jgi:hypothetical protein